jgi:malate dehydrogenase (decarboxylating)
MFFSARDKGEMASMVYNWENDDVDAVVVTDGSRFVAGVGFTKLGPVFTI